MFWFLLSLSIVLALAFLLWQDDYGLTLPGFLGAFLFGLFLLCLVVWKVSLHYDRATCHAWANKTGRATRFAYYNAFSWDCLTRAHDGRWVPKSQIGDYNK